MLSEPEILQTLNMRTRAVLTVPVGLAAPSRSHAAAAGDANWPQFRGSHAAGVNANANLPDNQKETN